MLEIRNLYFEYHEKLLLKNININLSAGDLLHLRGSNGAGKTTLLRLIAGLFEPDAGDIRIHNIKFKEDPFHYLQQLCFISHKLGINPYLTVFENAFFDLQSHLSISEINKILVDYNLENVANKRAANLSAGQLRRVALMRLALSSAKLWLLDEPLIALDDNGIKLLTNGIQKHREEGGCIILTSHQTLPLTMGDYQEYVLC